MKAALFTSGYLRAYLSVLFSLCAFISHAQVRDSIDGTQNATTKTLSLKEFCCGGGCTANAPYYCGQTQDVLKFNLCIKVTANASNYEYGKHAWQATFDVNPRIESRAGGYCTGPKFYTFDVNPFNGIATGDVLIPFALNEKKPEAIYKLEINTNSQSYPTTYTPPVLDIVDALNNGFVNSSNSPYQFVFDISSFSTTGIDPADLKIVYYIETIDADYEANASAATILQKPLSANPVNFQWNLCQAALYQVQVMRLYNSVEPSISNPPQNEIKVNSADINWNNAFNIYTKSNNIDLTLAEGTGYYIWRVRAITDKYPGGEANPLNWKPWSASNYPSPLSPVSYVLDPSNTSGNPDIFYYDQFDYERNWIYNRHFIERDENTTPYYQSGMYENLVGEGITYANGLGMTRQSQGKSNSINRVVVNSSFQDYAGRNAISTLPAAITSQSYLEYADNLNGGFNTSMFDDDGNYNSPPALTGTISDYYSDQNDDVDIPAADGYPYTRTLYQRNPLSIAKETSMAGDAHKIGNGHTNLNLLGAVADIELVRIFGNEAPGEKTVFKQINVDPNKTISISYIDKAGKTVATCLSKAPSEYLEEIDAPDPFVITHTLNANQQFDEYILASKALVFEQPTMLTFKYDLLKEKYEDLCANICKSCDFDIEFDLYSEDNMETPLWSEQVSIDPSNSNCGLYTGALENIALTTSTYNVSDPGTYYITKKLIFKSVNPSSGKTYYDEHKEELIAALETILWQSLSPATTNWKVMDGNGVPVVPAVPDINLDVFRQKLLDKEMNTAGGVYEMLGIDPASDNVYERQLVLDDPNCSESIALSVQACAKPDCSDPAVFAQTLIDYLVDEIDYANLQTYPNAQVLSVSNDPEDHFRLNNMLFSQHANIAWGLSGVQQAGDQYYMEYTTAQFKDIIAEMLDEDPDMGYTCEKLNESWKGAVYQFIQTHIANLNPQPANVTVNPDLLDIFFTNAGYHFTCGTDITGTFGGTVGYFSHPYRCFFYPQKTLLDAYVGGALTAAACTVAGCSTAVQTNVLSIIGFNELIEPGIGCSPLSVNDLGNSSPPDNFNPNWNQTTPYPQVVNCTTFSQTDLLAFYKTIQYPTDPAVAAAALPFTISPTLNLDEGMHFIAMQEEECRNICEGRRTEFRDLVSNAMLTQWNTEVEDYDFPITSFNPYNVNLNEFAINWNDLHTEMVMENCKSKCSLHAEVVNISGTNMIQVDKVKAKDFLKPLSYDVKLLKNDIASSTHIYDINTIGYHCNNCKTRYAGNAVDFSSVPGYTPSSPAWIEGQIYASTIEHISTTGEEIDLDGGIYMTCCPPAPTGTSQYPVENIDIGILKDNDWPRVAMVNSERVYSATNLMVPWLNKKMTQVKNQFVSGPNSTYDWNIYEQVLHYLNPVSYPGFGLTGYHVFSPDNNNGNTELPSAPSGSSSNKVVTLDDKEAFFHLGGINASAPVSFNGFIIERTANEYLPMHAQMKVTIKVTVDPLSPPASYPQQVTIKEDLKDYTTYMPFPLYSPVIEFVSDHSFMEGHKKFNSASDVLEFSYYTNIDKDNKNTKNTWAICNHALMDAHNSCGSNAGNWMVTGTYPFANLEYSDFTITVSDGVTTNTQTSVHTVKVPMLSQYANTSDAPVLFDCEDYTPDITVHWLYNGTLPAPYDPAGTFKANQAVQVVPFYYCHKDNTGALVQDALWDIVSYKIYWHNYFCAQWIPKEMPEIIEESPVTCADMAAQEVYNQLKSGTDKILKKHTDDFYTQYVNKCATAANLTDAFEVSYEVGYHHYTLYYYDRAGNLVRTVPPAGVDVTSTDRSTTPPHTLVTQYDYNSLNQVTRQSTPDGGETRFWYDHVGRVRFSQNAEQVFSDYYSYTKYDNLGRIIESGECTISSPTLLNANIDNNLYPDATNGVHDVTYTYYTDQYKTSPTAYLKNCSDMEQRNLLHRVSHTLTDHDGTLTTVIDNTITAYSYDPHGNVEWLAQKVADMPFVFTRYEYDLVSNSVKKVAYNECDKDAFFHRYTYNEDKNIIKVETSRDDVQWDTDASYTYYPHGPLKSVLMGQDKVQQINYAYTINGWLKGMNHISRNYGTVDFQAGTDINPLYAMKLRYFDDDFKRDETPSNPGVPSGFNTTDGYFYTNDAFQNTARENLYNGNIPEVITAIRNPNPAATNNDYLYANQYTYDELNRLVKADYLERQAGTHLDYLTDFAEEFQYDANGNIMSAKRRSSAAVGNIDRLTYNYTAGTNKLASVSDALTTAGLPADYDIKNGQSTANYQYDAIGNLTKDLQGGLRIEWNAMGKVKQILKNNTRIQYFYDAMGNRVMKMVHNNYTLNLPPETQEYYIRDASGNLMTTYKRANAPSGTNYNMKLTANDQPIYGSDRIGSHISGFQKNNTNTSTVYSGSYGYYVLLPTISLPAASSLKSDRLVSYRMMDYKRYEIKDHLGNVRTTFGDYRLSTVTGTGIGGTAPYTKTNFEADQKSMYNLYAFGMPRYGNDQYYEANDIPLSLTSTYTYMFGFNGKENNNDIKGVGNWQDYGLRVYDTRLGRFASVDPLADDYSYYTPYQFAGNNPVKFVDLDGGEPKDPGIYGGQGGEAPEYTIDPKTKQETSSADIHKWVWSNNSWNKANIAVTNSELTKIFPNGKKEHLKNIESTINLYGADYGLTSYNHIAHLLGQVGHETGGFTKSATVEGGSYSLERIKVVFGSDSRQYASALTDSKYIRNEVNFLNMAYANKLGNGNEASGDGYLYRGRGYIQLTGKSNYTEFNKFYQSMYGNSVNLVANPGLVGTDNRIGILSALFYFKQHTVPAINKGRNFTQITKTVNAKAVGLKERQEIYEKSKKIFE